MLRVQHGKFYRRRDGKVVQMFETWPGANYPFSTASESTSYTSHGRVYNTGHTCPLDLEEEVPDPAALPPVTHERVMSVSDMYSALQYVTFPGYTFRVVQQGKPVAPYLQAEFYAPCNHEGGAPTLQKTRKWQLSPHMTKSEVVQTAFKCVVTSLEHEAREQFKYRDAAIFGPHFDVDDLVDLVQSGNEDTRK